MSEMERNRIEDVDAVVGVMAEAQEADRKRVVPVEDQTEGQTTEHWAAELIREFDADARAWHRRQGWDAFGLAMLSCVTAISCGAALVGAFWQPIVAGIGVVNMMLTGAWLHKAKAGWDA